MQVFDHVIEYLRTVRFSDAELPLPRGRADLALLVREADFYGLPGLSAKACSCSALATTWRASWAITAGDC